MKLKKLGILSCLGLFSIVSNAGMNSSCFAAGNENQEEKKNEIYKFKDYVLGFDGETSIKDKKLYKALDATQNTIYNDLIDNNLGYTLSQEAGSLELYTRAYVSKIYNADEVPAKYAALDLSVFDVSCAKTKFEKKLNGTKLGFIFEGDANTLDTVKKYVGLINQLKPEYKFEFTRIRNEKDIVVPSEDENVEDQQIHLNDIYLCRCIEPAETGLSEKDAEIIKDAVSFELANLIELVDGKVDKQSYLKKIAEIALNIKTVFDQVAETTERVIKLEKSAENLYSKIEEEENKWKASNTNNNEHQIVFKNRNNIISQDKFDEGESNYNIVNSVNEEDRFKKLPKIENKKHDQNEIKNENQHVNEIIVKDQNENTEGNISQTPPLITKPKIVNPNGKPKQTKPNPYKGQKRIKDKKTGTTKFFKPEKNEDEQV